MNKMNRIHTCTKKLCKNKQCKKQYCNPGCIGTIFEKTYNVKHAKGLHAKGLHAKNIMLTRKVMFGKKRNVLKNNFYIRLPKKKRNTLKKKGAISGCIEW